MGVAHHLHVHIRHPAVHAAAARCQHGGDEGQLPARGGLLRPGGRGAEPHGVQGVHRRHGRGGRQASGDTGEHGGARAGAGDEGRAGRAVEGGHRVRLRPRGVRVVASVQERDADAQQRGGGAAHDAERQRRVCQRPAEGGRHIGVPQAGRGRQQGLRHGGALARQRLRAPLRLFVAQGGVGSRHVGRRAEPEHQRGRRLEAQAYRLQLRQDHPLSDGCLLQVFGAYGDTRPLPQAYVYIQPLRVQHHQHHQRPAPGHRSGLLEDDFEDALPRLVPCRSAGVCRHVRGGLSRHLSGRRRRFAGIQDPHVCVGA
mmetsp:Transcript_35041/g.88524  ORF Transcript_35041/g.88524 Transcript_35041/m.88524 type:complete len:313 (+) Transcript_35041:966-1904(+)